jgi:RNA-binding protein YhbY
VESGFDLLIISIKGRSAVCSMRWLMLMVLASLGQAALSASPLSGGSSSLSGSQKRQLRATAGRLASEKLLRSVIISEPARSASALSQQLDAGELVRARFAHAESKKEAAVLAGELANLLGDVMVAQVLGHTALFYRPSSRRLVELDPPVEP